MDFVLRLSEAHVNVIIHALGRLPYSDVAPVFTTIGLQLNEQTAPRANERREG